MKSEQLRKKFSAHFGSEPEKIVKAPGRVNLIGEHTDYNEGFVLPCAIDYCTLVAVMKRDDRQIQVLALDWSDETYAFSLDEEIKFHPDQMWSNYIRGVISELKLLGYPLQGCNIAVTGNVPQGAGLSSSAALEVAVTVALVAAANGSISETQSKDLQLDRLTIAQIGQAAENNFVGCACGIMDQLISSTGVDGHALLIDCQDYQLTPVMIPDEL